MGSTMWPPVRHYCMDGSGAPSFLAGRARDPNTVLAHTGGSTRIFSCTRCEAPGTCDAAFPRHSHCLPYRSECFQRIALPDCAHGDCAVRLALRLRAVFTNPRRECPVHATGTDFAILWH